MRPASPNDIAGYPTAIITRIFQDLENESPRPPFAITTGDYMFTNPYGSQSGAQMDLYLGAEAAYSNIVFHAMGNHECTGGTASNCGPGTMFGTTNNYATFLSRMIAPKRCYMVRSATPSPCDSLVIDSAQTVERMPTTPGPITTSFKRPLQPQRDPTRRQETSYFSSIASRACLLKRIIRLLGAA